MVCGLPIAALIALSRLFTGWGDGSGIYESHAIKESLPLFALAAVPLAYLPFSGRRLSAGFLFLSFALVVSYVVYVFPQVSHESAVIGLIVAAIVLWIFWSIRMSLEKEPNHAPEPTAPSGRGSS